MPSIRPLATLALALCRQDLKARFAGALLGSLWVLIWPLVQLFIYIVVFGKFMGARLTAVQDQAMFSYGLYVAAGLLAWTCFANTLQRTSRIFVDKRQIIGKVPVDLKVFPLSICLQELLPLAAGYLLLIIACCILGWQPSPSLLFCSLLALTAQQLLAMGLGLFFAVLCAFIRDTQEAVAVALQMAFWFTPIVYHPSILPDWVQKALLVNPMTHVCQVLQQCFVLGGSVSLAGMGYVCLCALIACALGLWTLKSKESGVRDVL
ncbi:MAG: ABC transporter permease [Desulfovibrio sp.]|nr:ABC transporter permease [Desulfovibrio sp.]